MSAASSCASTAVLGYAPKQDGPAISIVYYAMEGEEIPASTMAARAKAKAITRSPANRMSKKPISAKRLPV
jgi:hypothetical protein